MLKFLRRSKRVVIGRLIKCGKLPTILVRLLDLCCLSFDRTTRVEVRNLEVTLIGHLIDITGIVCLVNIHLLELVI